MLVGTQRKVQSLQTSDAEALAFYLTIISIQGRVCSKYFWGWQEDIQNQGYKNLPWLKRKSCGWCAKAEHNLRVSRTVPQKMNGEGSSLLVRCSVFLNWLLHSGNKGKMKKITQKLNPSYWTVSKSCKCQI